MKVSELKNVPPGLQQDFLNVQRILADRGIVSQHLQALSHEVSQHPRYRENPRAALQEVLAHHEGQRNFDPALPRYTDNVDAGEFLGNIRAARSFDDIGAPPQHGPETHRIQWHVVASELERIRRDEQPNHQHQLQHAASSTALYRELGNEAYHRDDEHGRRWYAWDALMDRQGANPAAPNTFVAIDESTPNVFAGDQRLRNPGAADAIPRDAGLPFQFSNMMLGPDQHFPAARRGSLEALRKGVAQGQEEATQHRDRILAEDRERRRAERPRRRVAGALGVAGGALGAGLAHHFGAASTWALGLAGGAGALALGGLGYLGYHHFQRWRRGRR